MANIIQRITTWAAGQILKAADLNGEFNNVVNLINNVNSGSTSLTSPAVGANPTTALGIASKQYVDNYVTYRRPVLQYSSGTVVNMETGINGTSGQARILFPDGTLRTDSTAGRINCNLAQNAVLSGTAQSGLRTGSQTANTWYFFYAVETSDNTSNFVHVADTLAPTQANFATLNTNFGTNAWVYLGALPNGDNSGSTNVILSFVMVGNRVMLRNTCTGNALPGVGIRFATTAAALTATYTYASGNSIASAQTPANILIGTLQAMSGTVSTKKVQVHDAAAAVIYYLCPDPVATSFIAFRVVDVALSLGLQCLTVTTNQAMDIMFSGYIDSVLGVGSNPIL